jgi:hypothetical protein
MKQTLAYGATTQILSKNYLQVITKIAALFERQF